MTTRDELYLYEEVLLLALQDDAGTMTSGAWYRQALAGALLAELMLLERLRPSTDGKKVEVASRTPVGDALLDECLQRVEDLGKPMALKGLLGKLANQGDLKHRAAEGLCRRGVLRADKDKVLLFFDRRIYPEVDARPERKLVERLRRAVFTDESDVDPRTVVTLSLAHQAQILKAVFDRKELKGRKKRIEAVIEGEATGAAAKEVLEAVQAAVIVSTCVVPVIVS